MPREMRYRWPIETCSSVDVDCIDHIVDIFGSIRCVGGLILASWCEKQASIWGECQSSEKGSTSLVPVYGCVLDTSVAHVAHQVGIRGLLHW